MKHDINDRNDIRRMVDTFYDHVVDDPLIGPLFTEAARVNWEQHLPVMYAFWSTLLLKERSYAGNPMAVHAALNRKQTLRAEHFDAWVRLFHAAVDELFEGRNAEAAKTRGAQIAQLMLHRMRESETM